MSNEHAIRQLAHYIDQSKTVFYILRLRLSESVNGLLIALRKPWSILIIVDRHSESDTLYVFTKLPQIK